MESMERRDVLAGLAAAPALLTFHTTSASATVADSPSTGGPRYFPWPLIKPGSKITWPAGAVALSADGTSRAGLAGLSTVPARGGPSRHVYLTGVSEGTYTVSTHGRRPTRVTWDADRYPFLRVWGEYGQRTHVPYWGKYYGLIITPVAHPARMGGGHV